jgi:hypothetical protein
MPGIVIGFLVVVRAQTETAESLAGVVTRCLVDMWIHDAFFLDDAGKELQLTPPSANVSLNKVRFVIGPSEIVVSASTAQIHILAEQRG